MCTGDYKLLCLITIFKRFTCCRLITRNTLEEKIMSLQQFKIHTARSVISDDNSSISSMNTDQVITQTFTFRITQMLLT